MEVASELERVPPYSSLDLADCATPTTDLGGPSSEREVNGGGTSGSSDDDGGMDKLLEELMDIHGVAELAADEYSGGGNCANGSEEVGLEGESILREAFGGVGGGAVDVPVEVKTRDTEADAASASAIVTGIKGGRGGGRKDSEVGVPSPLPAGGSRDSGPKRAAVNLMIPVMPMLSFAKKGSTSAPSASREIDKGPLMNGSKNSLEKESEKNKSDKKSKDDEEDDDIIEIPRAENHAAEVRVPESQQSGSDTLKNVRSNNNVSNTRTSSGESMEVPSRKEVKGSNGDNRSKLLEDIIELEKEEQKFTSVESPAPKTKSAPPVTSTEGTRFTENRAASPQIPNNNRKNSQHKRESTVIGQQIMSSSCKRSNDTAELNKYKCLVCGQDGFVVFMHLKSHREETHPTIPFAARNELPFACGVCGKPFHLRKDALVCAILGHDPASLRKQMFRYACSQCPTESFGFHSVIALKRHWEMDHYHTFQSDTDTPTKRFEEDEDPLPSVIINENEATKIRAGNLPPGAEFSLVVERDLLNIKDMNDKTKHIHLCTVCNARLDTNYELNNHMQTHTAPAPKKPVYKCNKCPEEFVKLIELRTHFKVHLKSSKKSILRARKTIDKSTNAKSTPGPGLSPSTENGGNSLNRGPGRPRKTTVPIISNEARKSNTSSSSDKPTRHGVNEITMKKNLNRLANGIRKAIKTGNTPEKSSSNMGKSSKRITNTQSEERRKSSSATSEAPLHLHPIKLFKCNICVLHAFTSLNALQKHKRSAHQPNSMGNKSEDEENIETLNQLIHAEIMRNPGFVLVKKYQGENSPDQAIGRAASGPVKGKISGSRPSTPIHSSKKRKIENTNEEKNHSSSNSDLESPHSSKSSRPGPRSRMKFQCKTCPRSFRKQRLLNDHEKIHAAEDESKAKLPTIKMVEAKQVQEESPIKRSPGRPRKSILPAVAVSSVALSFMEKKEDPVGDGGTQRTTRAEEKGKNLANKLLPSLLTSLSGGRDKTKKLRSEPIPIPTTSRNTTTNATSQYELKNVQIICKKVDDILQLQSDSNQVKVDIPKSNQPLERSGKIDTRGNTTQNKSRTGGQQRRLLRTKGDPPEVTSTSPENTPMAETKAKKDEVDELEVISPKKRGPGRPSKKLLPAALVNAVPKTSPSVSPPPSLFSRFQTKEVEIILTRCDDESFQKSNQQKKTLPIASSSKQKSDSNSIPPSNKKDKMKTARKGKTTTSGNDNNRPKAPHNYSPPSVTPAGQCQMLMFKKDHRNFVELDSAFSTSTNSISEKDLRSTTTPASHSRTSGITPPLKPSTSRKRSATVSEEVVVKKIKKQTSDPDTPRIPRNAKELSKKDVSCPVIFKGKKNKGTTPKAIDNPVPDKHPCKQCGRSFDSEKALRHHVVMAHMSAKVATTRSTRPKSTSGARKPAPASVKMRKKGRKTE